MARTIKEIQQGITDALKEKHSDLSSSATAEWRLWSYVVAVAIHAFELLLSSFKSEIEELTRRITPGTRRWYVEICKRFQMGHELLYDPKTAMLYYAADDPKSRIVDVVAVSGDNAMLAIKVAKIDDNGKLKKFEPDQLHNFKGYIDTVKFVGVDVSVISTEADKVKYNIEVFYDPIKPRTQIEADIKKALDEFKNNLNFDSILYAGRLSDCVMHIDGVMTVTTNSIDRCGATEAEYTPVGTFCELQAGYFEWATESVLTITSI